MGKYCIEPYQCCNKKTGDMIYHNIDHPNGTLGTYWFILVPLYGDPKSLISSLQRHIILPLRLAIVKNMKRIW